MLILTYFIITRNYKIEGKISNKEIERAWKIFHIFLWKYKCHFDIIWYNLLYRKTLFLIITITAIFNIKQLYLINTFSIIFSFF